MTHTRSASESAADPARPARPGSGLSDLAVSPWGMPLALLNGEVRVAFAGRTFTEEQQDPRNSLIRQLDRCRHALPPAWVIVAHFYDVESGRMSLDERGHKNDYERFDIPIPRDGGINDLLEEASHPNRRFDVVICESISRTARRMYESLTVERALQKAGVELLAANEPIEIDGQDSEPEESGWRPIGNPQPLLAFEPLPGQVSAPIEVFCWREAEQVGQPSDPDEVGRVEWVRLSRIPQLAQQGRLLGAGTLVPLLLYLTRRAS